MSRLSVDSQATHLEDSPPYLNGYFGHRVPVGEYPETLEPFSSIPTNPRMLLPPIKLRHSISTESKTASAQDFPMAEPAVSPVIGDYPSAFETQPLHEHETWLGWYHDLGPTAQSSATCYPHPPILVSAPADAIEASEQGAQSLFCQLPPCSRLSISSSSSCKTSSSIQTQQPFFDLVSEICTEAARRKWAQEVERRLTIALATTRRDGPVRRHRESRGYAHARRWEPYPSPERRRHARSPLGGDERDHQTGPGTGLSTTLQFMDYISLIADATWSYARDTVSARLTAEAKAAGEMQAVYSLAIAIATRIEEAREGKLFDQEEMRVFTNLCVDWCRFLGYADGALRCEELRGGLEADHESVAC